MKANPLFSRLQMMGGNTALLGIAHYRDTAQINAWIAENRGLFPADMFASFAPSLADLDPDGSGGGFLEFDALPKHAACDLGGNLLRSRHILSFQRR